MNHNRALVTWLKGLFFPFKWLAAVLISRIVLTLKLILMCFCFSMLLRSTRVLEIKSDWQLEIQLNRAALVSTTERIFNLHINFRAIKGTITFFDTPRLPRFIECVPELCLSLFPKLVTANTGLRSRRQLNFILKAKFAINSVNKCQALCNFILDLVLPTEYMSIILAESADSCETAERARQLIPMQNTEISDSQRKLPI